MIPDQHRGGATEITAISVAGIAPWDRIAK
jgi:hypothetical protein